MAYCHKRGITPQAELLNFFEGSVCGIIQRGLSPLKKKIEIEFSRDDDPIVLEQSDAVGSPASVRAKPPRRRLLAAALIVSNVPK